jgi:putative FmdB family regulatory protein
MPLYEYQCDACGRRFERIQKFSDPPASECPTCGGAVRKLLSPPAIQFKGSGFYITDYVKSGSSDGAKADNKGDKGADSAPAPPGDKKPEAPASAPKADSSATPKSEPAKPAAAGTKE